MNEHPRQMTFEVPVPAVAGGSDDSNPVFIAPYDFTLESVTFVPKSTITGANTNTRKHELVNKGAAGSGSTVMASLQYNSGVNATGFDEKTITNSGTAADLNGSSGDVVAFASTHVGTGLADPGGLLKVTISKR